MAASILVAPVQGQRDAERGGGEASEIPGVLKQPRLNHRGRAVKAELIDGPGGLKMQERPDGVGCCAQFRSEWCVGRHQGG